MKISEELNNAFINLSKSLSHRANCELNKLVILAEIGRKNMNCEPSSTARGWKDYAEILEKELTYKYLKDYGYDTRGATSS